MKHIFTLLLLISTCPLFSQNWLNGTTHGSNGYDVVSNIDINSVHETIVSGILGDTTQIGSDLLLPLANSSFGYIAKYDENRQPLWAKAIHVNLGYSAQNPIFNFHCVSALDNSIYVSSHFADTVGFGLDTLVEERGGTFLARLDPDGDYVWARNFGQPNVPGSNAMQLSPSTCDVYGNIYLACAFTDEARFRMDTLYKNSGGGIYIIKFNEMGDEVWVRQCGGMGNSNRAYDIEADEDGGIYVTGLVSGESHFGSDIFDISPGRNVSYITKVSDDGDFMWTKIGGATTPNNPGGQMASETVGFSIAVADDGFVFNTGAFMDTVLFSGQLLNPQCGNNYCRNFFLSAYDKQGNFKWIKQSPASSPSSAGYDMVVDPNGRLFLAGTFTNYLEFDGQSVTYDSPDNFVAKFDTTGRCKWLIHAAGEYRNFSLDARCPDSTITVGTSYQGWPGNLAFSGLPTTSNYENAIVELGTDYNCMVISTDADEAVELPPLTIYPNPAADRLFIEMPTDHQANGQLVLMDMFGRVQQNMDAACSLCEMELNGLPAGVYFVAWRGENGVQSKETAFVKQ